MRNPLFLAVALVTGLSGASPARADGDADAATHGDDAATPQTTLDAETNGVRVRQYQLGCLSQLTYLIVSRGEAAVVDPQRDVGHYLRDAKQLGAKVTTVFLTHTNADFVAGHTEFARLGAKIHISGASGSKFAHEALVDGSTVKVGDATITAWATPGHTLDAMTLLLRVPGATVDPLYAFTGDTLFIGGIGRPDLVGGDSTPMRLAGSAFDSITRLKGLPDEVRILPAHGAGSLCGAHLAPETVSTIGAQRTSNPYFEDMSRARFMSLVVTGLPAAPAYFQHNVRLNREGPPVIEGAPATPTPLTPAEVDAKARTGAWLIDLRDAKAYAAGHVEGSINVAVRGRLDTWTGTVVPFDAAVVLIGSDTEVREAALRFRRIGLDRVDGQLAGGVDAWKAAGLPLRTTELWTPARLAQAMREGREPVIVDVRTADEYVDVRLGDYANLALSEWDRFGQVLDPKAPVLFVCNSAYRSSMAVGLAERLGFANASSLEGGLDAWLTAGLPTKGSAPVVSSPAAKPSASPAAAAGGGFLLPESIAPAALAVGLLDQARAWAVIDVRPAWAFGEYHVPGATRVELDGLLEHVRRLDPALRVVIVDRDGSTAHAAAGMLAALLPGRPVRVLSGGTAAFWRDVEWLGNSPAAQSAPAATTPGATPQPSAPAPSNVSPLKKRAAGC